MRVEPAAALVGDVAVPGTKSISHRALLLGAIAEGESDIRNFGRAGDTESTISALRALGVEVHPEPEHALCDAAQQIPVADFPHFSDEIRAFTSLMGRVVG